MIDAALEHSPADYVRWLLVPAESPLVGMLGLEGLRIFEACTAALILMTLAREVNESALRSVAVRLYGVWKGNPDQRVRGCVGRIISAVVPPLKELGYSDFMQGNQKVMLADLEDAASSGTNNPDGFLDRIVDDRYQRLLKWATPCHPSSLEDCRLAAAA